jgi:hypothetical protein
MNEYLRKIFSKYNQYNSEYRIYTDTVTKMPINFDYKRQQKTSDDYDFLVYTNGCSWMASKYLEDLVDICVPNALHINRAKAGQGNLQIIDKTVMDIKYFKKKLDIPIYAFISLTEVGRNREEFSLVNPHNVESLNNYLKQILFAEYKELDTILTQLGIEYHITTSFCSNDFNNNKTIVDNCGNFPKFNLYAVAPGIIEFMKDRNHLFKFNTEQYTEEITKINKYLDCLKQSDRLDNTYHPISWEAYVPILEFLDQYSLLLKN